MKHYHLIMYFIIVIHFFFLYKIIRLYNTSETFMMFNIYKGLQRQKE
jgi:hypothetical protein